MHCGLVAIFAKFRMWFYYTNGIVVIPFYLFLTFVISKKKGLFFAHLGTKNASTFVDCLHAIYMKRHPYYNYKS